MISTKNLQTLYSKLVKNNVFDSKSHNERKCILSYSDLLKLSSNELADCKVKIMQLTTQVNNIFTILDQLKPKYTKRDIIHSQHNFLLGNSVKEIEAIKINMAILAENQDILRKH